MTCLPEPPSRTLFASKRPSDATAIAPARYVLYSVCVSVSVCRREGVY